MILDSSAVVPILLKEPDSDELVDKLFGRGDLALVKVTGRGNKRVESLRIADIFRANVVDSSHDHFVFEVTGKSDKLDVFIDLMKPLGLVDVSRTGVVAISRGPKGF